MTEPGRGLLSSSFLLDRNRPHPVGGSLSRLTSLPALKEEKERVEAERHPSGRGKEVTSHGHTREGFYPPRPTFDAAL